MYSSELTSLVEFYWGSVDFWRLATVVPLMGVAAFVLKAPVQRLLTTPSRKHHDLRLFRESESKMSDRDLRSLVGSLGGDICYLPQWTRLRSYIKFFRAEGNTYLDERLKSVCNNLLEELIDLEVFILEHFFADCSVRGERMLGMHPEWRNTQQRKEDSSNYLRCQVELYSILDRLFETHRAYISCARSRLGIRESSAIGPQLITRPSDSSGTPKGKTTPAENPV